MNEVKNKGYISIHREIMDHWVWRGEPFSKGQAWVDLILLANYKQEKFPYKGQIVEGERGTVYRSISWLAERWSWSRDKTRRFLKLLQEDQMITVETTKHNTTITLINYDFFQSSPTTNNTINNSTDLTTNNTTDNTTDLATNHTTSQQQTDIYNNNIYTDTNAVKDIYESKYIDIQSPEEIAEAQQWFDSL